MCYSAPPSRAVLWLSFWLRCEKQNFLSDKGSATFISSVAHSVTHKIVNNVVQNVLFAIEKLDFFF